MKTPMTPQEYILLQTRINSSSHHLEYIIIGMACAVVSAITFILGDLYETIIFSAFIMSAFTFIGCGLWGILISARHNKQKQLTVYFKNGWSFEEAAKKLEYLPKSQQEYGGMASDS